MSNIIPYSLKRHSVTSFPLPEPARLQVKSHRPRTCSLRSSSLLHRKAETYIYICISHTLATQTHTLPPSTQGHIRLPQDLSNGVQHPEVILVRKISSAQKIVSTSTEDTGVSLLRLSIQSCLPERHTSTLQAARDPTTCLYCV